MRESKGRRNILAIESAVAGGSVALIRDEDAPVLRREGNDCSRAEKLISVIASVLDEASLTLQDLDMIAVSTGPGSYSGIRIGLATALGLGNAVDVRCVGVSILDAMAHAALPAGAVIAAVPVGKNDVAWQPFELKKQDGQKARAAAELLPMSSFADKLLHFPDFTLFAQTDLLVTLSDRLPGVMPRVDAGTDLAEYVGRFASVANKTDSSLRPIYLRNSNAAIRPTAI